MRSLSLVALTVACFLSTLPAFAQREKFTPDDLDTIYSKWPGIQKTPAGIRYLVLREGKGETANPGDMVSVLYDGTLLNGKRFDRSEDPAHPFIFRVGRHFVIEGWDEVLQMMKPGEKLMAIIPPEMAYGFRGKAPFIPPDASLVFTIELLAVTREQ